MGQQLQNGPQQQTVALEFTGAQVDTIIMALQKQPLEVSIDAFMSIQRQLARMQQTQRQAAEAEAGPRPL